MDELVKILKEREVYLDGRLIYVQSKEYEEILTAWNEILWLWKWSILGHILVERR